MMAINNGNDSLYIMRNGSIIKLNTNGLPQNLYVKSITSYNNTWYIGTTVGVYESPDMIKWTPINNTNYYTGMYTQKICFLSSNEMFLGTNDGIWKNDFLVGVNNISNPSENIKVFPNPVNDLLKIEIQSTVGNQNPNYIDIYSETGEKVYSKISYSQNTEINFSGFHQGYILSGYRMGIIYIQRK